MTRRELIKAAAEKYARQRSSIRIENSDATLPKQRGAEISFQIDNSALPEQPSGVETSIRIENSREGEVESCIRTQKAPAPKPKRKPRPTGIKWKLNGSRGVTVLGVGKEEALRIIEETFGKQTPDAEAERRVKCAVQIFEKVPIE